MAEGGADEARTSRRRRGRAQKRKRMSRKHERLLHNLKWIGGGVAVGLPVLAALIYAVSQY
jgi:hypothetical protein